MNVLICGERGFIGRHVTAALRAQGHQVRGLRQTVNGQPQALDFGDATTPARWRPWLDGVDAVVNAVGVLRDTTRRPLSVVHARAPVALFQACAELGVRRLIQVSALGVDASPTAYASTKLAAETALNQLAAQGQLDAAILRPSVVFGAGGAASEMFRTLARLPVLSMPAPAFTAKIQPVAVQDVAELIAALLGPQRDWCGTVACVGPQALTTAEFIARLRQEMGKSAPLRLPLPQLVGQAMARVGDLVPASPWCSETLSLLSQDNTADATVFAQLLGHAPRMPGLATVSS
ncbi:MAG: NAD-dependent epimerase/dehydratase family protein [Burkholderiales bacterium]|nr:NAD-dependent epimerase/dehydratase family protein [Burkholderiales bacterium]